jgi:hypothetical protein
VEEQRLTVKAMQLSAAIATTKAHQSKSGSGLGVGNKQKGNGRPNGQTNINNQERGSHGKGPGTAGTD